MHPKRTRYILAQRLRKPFRVSFSRLEFPVHDGTEFGDQNIWVQHSVHGAIFGKNFDFVVDRVNFVFV